MKRLLWWIKWTGIAVLLFPLARRSAGNWRGYEAIGGEILILGLPVYIHALRAVAKDWEREIKEIWSKSA